MEFNVAERMGSLLTQDVGEREEIARKCARRTTFERVKTYLRSGHMKWARWRRSFDTLIASPVSR